MVTSAMPREEASALVNSLSHTHTHTRSVSHDTHMTSLPPSSHKQSVTVMTTHRPVTLALETVPATMWAWSDPPAPPVPSIILTREMLTISATVSPSNTTHTPHTSAQSTTHHTHAHTPHTTHHTHTHTHHTHTHHTPHTHTSPFSSVYSETNTSEVPICCVYIVLYIYNMCYCLNVCVCVCVLSDSLCPQTKCPSGLCTHSRCRTLVRGRVSTSRSLRTISLSPSGSRSGKILWNRRCMCSCFWAGVRATHTDTCT